MSCQKALRQCQLPCACVPLPMLLFGWCWPLCLWWEKRQLLRPTILFPVWAAQHHQTSVQRRCGVGELAPRVYPGLSGAGQASC